MERRKFIQNSGLLAAGIYHTPLKAIAGPFVQSPLLHNIPLDKKLNPEWIKSLYHRGFVTTYKKTKNDFGLDSNKFIFCSILDNLKFFKYLLKNIFGIGSKLITPIFKLYFFLYDFAKLNNF